MTVEPLRVALRQGLGWVHRTGDIVLWSESAVPELWEAIADREAALPDLGRLATGSYQRWVAIDVHDQTCGASCDLLLIQPGDPHSLKIHRRTVHPLRNLDGLGVGGAGAGPAEPHSHLEMGTVPAGGFVLLKRIEPHTEGPSLVPADMSPVIGSHGPKENPLPESGPATVDFQASSQYAGAPSPSPLRRPGEARPGLNRKRQQTPERFSVLLDDGHTTPVGGGLVVGRNPAKDLPDGFEPLTVSGVGVSRVHWEVWPADDGELLITDRGSTGGTVVESPSGETTSVEPGVPVKIVAGSAVLFAKRRATVVSR